MLEAIIFDMDGVIIDTEPFFHESENLILKKYGHEVPIAYHYQFQGTTHEFMWGLMKEKYSLPETVPNLVMEANRLREELIEEEGLKTIPNVISFIDRLTNKDVPISIASSSPEKDIINTIKQFSLQNEIDYYISGENVKNSKPAPDIFLNVSNHFNVNPENCIVIEDSKNGVLAGVKAGMKVIAYENPNFPPQDLSAASKVVTSFKNLNYQNLEKLIKT